MKGNIFIDALHKVGVRDETKEESSMKELKAKIKAAVKELTDDTEKPLHLNDSGTTAIIDLIEMQTGKKVMAGVLCGGSVANTIYAAVHNLEPQIKDLDYFYGRYDVFNYTLETNKEHLREHFNGVIDGTLEEVPLGDGGYGGTEMSARSYKLVDVTEDGLYNNILTNIDQAQVMPVIENFDLTCCMAGLKVSDRDSSDMYMDERFIEFLKTKQVIPTLGDTAFSTACRAIKKAEQLDAYYDEEFWTKVLAFCCKLRHANGEVERVFDNKMSIYRTSAVMQKYFDVEESKILAHNGEVVYNVASKSPHTRVSELAEDIFGVAIPEFDETRFKLNSVGHDVQAIIKMAAYHNAKGIVKSNLFAFAKAKAWTAYVDNLGGIIQEDTKVEDIQIKVEDIGGLIPAFNSHTGDMSKYLSREEYRGPNGKVLSDKRTFTEAAKMWKVLRAAVKKYGELAYGVISRVTDSSYIMQDAADKVKNISNEPLVECLDITLLLDVLPKDTEVTELVSKADLYLEGEVMHHCVGGGYYTEISSKTARFFSIITPAGRSTLRIHLSKVRFNKEDYDDDDLEGLNIIKDRGPSTPGSAIEYVVSAYEAQHYAYNNKRPVNSNRAVAAKLLLHMREHGYYVKSVDEEIEAARDNRGEIEVDVIRADFFNPAPELLTPEGLHCITAFAEAKANRRNSQIDEAHKDAELKRLKDEDFPF